MSRDVITEFLARVHFYDEEHGGRRSPPFSGYRPLIDFGTGRNDVEISFPEGVSGRQGVHQLVRIRPAHPELVQDHLRPGAFFLLKEGLPSPIGEGVVLGLDETEPWRSTTVLDQLEEWVRSNEDELRRRGFAPSFERGPLTDKSAAWANLDGNGWIVQVMAWESGEVELLARREESEELEVNEYHELHDPSELVPRLSWLVGLVTSTV